MLTAAEVLDAVNAFLNADLPEPIYLQPPDGWRDRPEARGKVLKCVKALYWFKESPRLWCNLLRSTLAKIDFEETEQCIFKRKLFYYSSFWTISWWHTQRRTTRKRLDPNRTSETTINRPRQGTTFIRPRRGRRRWSISQTVQHSDCATRICYWNVRSMTRRSYSDAVGALNHLTPKGLYMQARTPFYQTLKQMILPLSMKVCKISAEFRLLRILLNLRFDLEESHYTRWGKAVAQSHMLRRLSSFFIARS